jgi:hypothetical protein
VEKLGGKLTTLKWEVTPDEETLNRLPSEERSQWMKNFAIGFATQPDSVAGYATKMQGWHNEWVLIIVDEACGIHPTIWETIMVGLVTNEKVKVLAIGNPTDPNCEFARACDEDSEWNVIRVDCEETPNYKEQREVIPGLMSYAQVEKLRKKYGTEGNGFLIRCKGIFPTFMEGTYYGFQMAALRKSGRLGYFDHDQSEVVYTAADFGTVHNAVIWFQIIRERVRIIDFIYDNTGMGIAGIWKVIETKPYNYSKLSHFCGPDILKSNRKNPLTGSELINDAAKLGYHLQPVVAESFDEGIRQTRKLFPDIDIHEPRCQELVKALDKYKQRKDERLSEMDKPVYYKDPEKTWACHPADALRHLTLAYRFGITRDGVLIGNPRAVAPRPEDAGVKDMLSV